MRRRHGLANEYRARQQVRERVGAVPRQLLSSHGGAHHLAGDGHHHPEIVRVGDGAQHVTFWRALPATAGLVDFVGEFTMSI